MNYRMLFHLLALSVRIVALFIVPAAIISLVHGEYASAAAFGITMAIMLLASLPAFFKKPRRTTLYAREGYVLVALVWIVVSIMGALPFYISRSIPSFVDCLFETVSGFTTTGASILKNVEALPMGMLYWRSFSHWLGGMGVLVFLLAVSSFASGSGEGMFIMRAESPGPQVSKLVPRTMQTARILYAIYIVLTAVEFLMLILGGMPVFDAVCTAFGTAGTGGFGTRNDSLASFSPYIQWVVTAFMALFGVNFGVFYLILMGRFKRAARDEELRMYVIVILVAVTIVTGVIIPTYNGDFGESVRHAAFQVVSIITTTGFATTDYEYWPQICHLILITLMIIGACAGSTGGGVKCSRVIILFRNLKAEAVKLLHPNIVSPVKIDGKPVPHDTVDAVAAFFGAYAIIAVISMLLISLDGYSFETNVSSVMATLNNIGPGFGMTGPAGNYADFSTVSKIVLTLNMLIGRLEIFPMFILFMPHVWAKPRI